MHTKFTVGHDKHDPDKLKLLKKAEEELAKIRADIAKDWRESPEGKLAEQMAAGHGFSKVNVSWTSNGLMEVKLELQRDYDAEFRGRPSAPSLGEKTVNLLLTGKLLNDGQKKALLKRLGVDFDALTAEAPVEEAYP